MLDGLADSPRSCFRGRKRACVTYCITYILSCITKHSPHYRILMVGRILGGIATSLLFSAFESWLVAEHNKVRIDFASNKFPFASMHLSKRCKLETHRG